MNRRNNVNHNRIIRLVKIALGAAVLCVLAPLSFPIGPVPISLGSFAVYFVAAVTGRKQGTLAVLLYLLIGAVGVPVFAGWTAGAARLAGPTGGFLLGYLPCAYITGLLSDKSGNKKRMLPAGMIIGTVVLYAAGLVWFMILSDSDFPHAFSACVLYFLPGDGIKIILAYVVSAPVKASAYRFLCSQREDGAD